MPFGPDAAFKTERRGNSAPIPPDIESLLNRQQSNTLRSIQSFGWRLAFVRRTLSGEAITFVISPDRQRYAVLEKDGRVDMQPEIALRS
jgi:hypothetical protein